MQPNWKAVALMCVGMACAIITTVAACPRPHASIWTSIMLILCIVLSLAPLLYTTNWRQRTFGVFCTAVVIGVSGMVFTSIPRDAKAVVCASDGAYYDDRRFFNPLTGEELAIFPDSLPIQVPLADGSLFTGYVDVVDPIEIVRAYGADISVEERLPALVAQSVAAFTMYADTTTTDFVARVTKSLPHDRQLVWALNTFPLAGLQLNRNTWKVSKPA